MSDISLQGTTNNGNTDTQGAGPITALSEDEFVMMCPFDDNSLNAAILSLYYLPPQFKLRVIIDAATAKLPFMHDSIKNRISLETETGTPIEASPFSNASAVVYSESTPVKGKSSAPRIVVSESAQTSSREGNVFTISQDSPEAVASAALSIAKAVA